MSGGRKHWTNVLTAAEELPPCLFMEQMILEKENAAVLAATVFASFPPLQENVTKLVTMDIGCTNMSLST